MPVYVQERSHGPAVKDGRQRITLAAPRNPGTPAPHAALDAPVLIDLAKTQTKPRERVKAAVCIFRARLVFTADALIRLSDVSFHQRGPHTGDAERIQRLLQAAEQGAPRADKLARDAVAQLAGFRDWKRLVAWHSHCDRRPRPDEGGQIVREVVGWA